MSKILDQIRTHSTIIEGGRNTFEKLVTEIQENKIDSFLFKSHSDKLSIDEFREFSSHFTLKHSNRKIIVIYVATISEIVQNSLLKTLEEGNVNVQFVIILPNASVLIKTVISRVQILKDLENENFDEKIISELYKNNVAQRLFNVKDLEETYDRQDLYFLVNSLLYKLVSLNKFKDIEKVLYIMKVFIEGNINKKQFLQYVFSVLPVV